MANNMYAYCGNNPVCRYDPIGELFLAVTLGGVAAWKIGAAILGLFGAVAVADTIAENPPAFPEISLPKIETKSDSEIKTNTKDVTLLPPKQAFRNPVHHVVAKADHRAEEARQILRDVGIDPTTDLRNLVVLPQKYHASLHTTAYHKYVTERLRLVAGDKAGVEATLASIKAEILAHAAVGIRWD